MISRLYALTWYNYTHSCKFCQVFLKKSFFVVEGCGSRLPIFWYRSGIGKSVRWSPVPFYNTVSIEKVTKKVNRFFSRYGNYILIVFFNSFLSVVSTVFYENLSVVSTQLKEVSDNPSVSFTMKLGFTRFLNISQDIDFQA